MDIGTLTGTLSLEDQFSSALTLATDKIKTFAEEAGGAFGAVAIAAGVMGAAIIGATSTIVALGEEGSKIQGVTDAFNILAEGAGTTGEALRGALSDGVRGTVSEMTLMQSTVKLLGSGMELTTNQAGLMGEAARALGKATGTDAANGLDIMSSALTTGRTRQLQMQIGLIDTKKGEEEFAASIGTTVDQLSAAGQLEGKRLAIFEATQAYLDRLGDSELSFAEKIKQGEVALEEWGAKLATSVAASPDVNEALDAVMNAMSEAFGGSSQALLDDIVAGIDMFARAVTASVPYVVAFAQQVGDGLKYIWNLLSQTYELLKPWGAALLDLVKPTVLDFFQGLAIEWETFTAAIRKGQDYVEYFALRLDGLSSSAAHAQVDADRLKVTIEESTPHIVKVAQATDVAKTAMEGLGASTKDNTQFLKDNTTAMETWADRMVALSDKVLAAEQENNLKGIDLTIAKLDAQEKAEIDAYKTQLDRHKIEQWQLNEAEELIREEFEQKRINAEDTDNQKKLEATTKLYSDLESVIESASHNAIQVQIDSAWRAAQAQIDAMEKAKTITIQDYDIIWSKAQATADNIIAKTLESDVHTRDHYVLLADQAKIAYDFATEHSDHYTTAWLTHLREAADAAQVTADKRTTEFDDSLAGIESHVASTASKAIGEFHQLEMATQSATAGSARQFAAGWIDIFERQGMSAGEAIGEFERTKAIHGFDYGDLQAIESSLHHAARGGYIDGPTVVGEEGKEIFVPSSPGVIIPHDRAFGGGDNYYISVAASMQPEEISRAVAEAIVYRQRTRGERQRTGA